MEPVEKPALEESLKPSDVATTLFNNQQTAAVFDDFTAVNGAQTAVLCDDFFVDGLLDFSNVVTDDTTEEGKNQENVEKYEAANVETTAFNVTSVTLSVNQPDFASLPSSELAVPADDLENLEWLSHFVDDSFSEYSLTCPPVKQLPPEPINKAQPAPELAAVQKKSSFSASVQTKARTKRARTGGRVWSLASPSLTESSAASSSSSSSSTTSSFSPWAGFSSFSPAQMAESLLGKPPVKKKKKKPASGTESFAAFVGGGGVQQGRRCSHCGVQKTPQWRAGPLGAKTLCNACGVRFKSGRLLPEYRPACSPTFSSELHSNNHRKVLEMRQKKDVEAGLAPPVQSF